MVPSVTSDDKFNVATEPLMVADEIVGTPVAPAQGEPVATVTFEGVGVGIAVTVEVLIGLLETSNDTAESVAPLVALTP